VVTDKAAHRRPPLAGRSAGVPEGQSWEERHIRVTFWIERTLREEVRRAAKTLGTSLTQFIAQALRRAVEEVS
jgi:predicted HicB family RNase H-like nuclease